MLLHELRMQIQLMACCLFLLKAFAWSKKQKSKLLQRKKVV